VPLSLYPIHSSPGEKELKEGCENFVFAAIWQKVLKQQALTLSFLAHWVAEPCCTGVNPFSSACPIHVIFFLTTTLLFFDGFYLENTTNCYL